MITDCQILGIQETLDARLIKAAYRKRVKELHPDSAETSTDVRNHFLFIEVCNAYRRLIKREQPEAPATKDTAGNGSTPGSAIVQHKDPAYIFYKRGTDFFSKIHPSSWNIALSSLSPNKSADKEERQTKERVQEVIKLFPKAYYYYSIVVNEYPDSVWSEDSRSKMDVIEDMSKRYKNILESFKE